MQGGLILQILVYESSLNVRKFSFHINAIRDARTDDAKCLSSVIITDVWIMSYYLHNTERLIIQ